MLKNVQALVAKFDLTHDETSDGHVLFSGSTPYSVRTEIFRTTQTLAEDSPLSFSEAEGVLAYFIVNAKPVFEPAGNPNPSPNPKEASLEAQLSDLKAQLQTVQHQFRERTANLLSANQQIEDLKCYLDKNEENLKQAKKDCEAAEQAHKNALQKLATKSWQTEQPLTFDSLAQAAENVTVQQLFDLTLANLQILDSDSNVETYARAAYNLASRGLNVYLKDAL